MAEIEATTLDEVTWDLSHLLEGVAPDGAQGHEAAVGALLDQADELADEFATAYEGKVAELDGAGPARGDGAARRDLRAGRARRQLRPPALLGRHRGPRQRRPDAAGERARHRDPDQAALLRARVGRGRRRPRRGAARHRGARVLPPPPADGAPLPAAPAVQARGEDRDRAVGHRAVAPGAGSSTSSPRRSGSTCRSEDEPVSARRRAVSASFDPDREAAPARPPRR